jgi:hypothetical protein
MNLLGKICVVLILVLSLVFMTLAMAVYATHKNWYQAVTAPGGLQEQLDNARDENNQLQDRYNRMEANLQAEIAQRTQRAAQAETERTALEQENRQITEQLATLNQNLATATAAVSATQKQNEQLNQQRDQLLAEIREEQQRRDNLFQIAKNATEELQQKLAEVSRLDEYVKQLVPEVAKYEAWLTSLGFNPQATPDAPAPTVDGVIRVVRQAGSQRVIEVSIGSDDGLRRGHELLIYRGNRYLGKAEVKQTWPDRAVAEIHPSSIEGAIQEGDRVATRIRFS